MDEKYSISDFKNVVLLKNQLITLSLDELKEISDYFTALKNLGKIFDSLKKISKKIKILFL